MNDLWAENTNKLSIAAERSYWAKKPFDGPPHRRVTFCSIMQCILGSESIFLISQPACIFRYPTCMFEYSIWYVVHVHCWISNGVATACVHHSVDHGDAQCTSEPLTLPGALIAFSSSKASVLKLDKLCICRTYLHATHQPKSLSGTAKWKRLQPAFTLVKKEMDYQEQPSRLQAKSREINVESSKRTWSPFPDLMDVVHPELTSSGSFLSSSFYLNEICKTFYWWSTQKPVNKYVQPSLLWATENCLLITQYFQFHLTAFLVLPNPTKSISAAYICVRFLSSCSLTCWFYAPMPSFGTLRFNTVETEWWSLLISVDSRVASLLYWM